MFLNDWFWATDHPRVCGENPEMAVCYLDNGGSPPRVRGKRECCALKSVNHRITPACAGKTSLRPDKTAAQSDHPRVCGENRYATSGERLKGGSPPRVRGKRRAAVQPSGHLRITPACAGKTFSGYLYPTLSSDHPRVCGENDDEEDDEDLHLGSPPRVRGKPGGVLMASKEERITPACAGKTLSVLLALQGSSDHPRVCGENDSME